MRYERDASTTWTKEEHTREKVRELEQLPREPRRRTASAHTSSGLQDAVAYIETSPKVTCSEIGDTFREEREVKAMVKLGNGRPQYVLRFVAPNTIEPASKLRPGTWIRITRGQMGSRPGRKETEIHVRAFEVIEPQSWRWVTFPAFPQQSIGSPLTAQRADLPLFWRWN